MGVLVVASPADEHGQFITQLLRSRGHRVVQLSGETVSRNQFTWRPETGLLVDVDGLGSERWAGIWRRTGTVQLDGIDPRYEAFARSEWFDAYDGALLEQPVAWLTPPATLQAAELKLVQLAVALRAGITIPETVVTNDPTEATAFAGRHRCVAKPVRYGLVADDPPRMAWTREVGVDDLRTLNGPPIILQRLVSARRHLRAVTVDSSCFVAQLVASELDWRSNLDNHARFTAAEPAAARLVSGEALRLATALGLGFSSQDWVIGEDGRAYFLDANPNGQWMFVGSETVNRIGSAIVDALEDRLDATNFTPDSRVPVRRPENGREPHRYGSGRRTSLDR